MLLAPLVLPAMCDAWGAAVTPTLAAFLQHSPFPPTGPLPPVAESDLDELRAAARGAPGDLVWPGLFPRPPVKLARLLLAARGDFEPSQLRQLAASRYGGDLARRNGPRDQRLYDAHDALACALVHPGLAASDRAALIGQLLGSPPRRRGWRSRRKSWAILRWAVRAAQLDPSCLPPSLQPSLALPPAGPLGVLPFPAQPQGHAGALDCYAAIWPRFRTHLARQRASHAWIDYVGIAELGRRHFAAFQSGCPAHWVSRVFAATEHILAHGDEPAQNLVVVGLFEAVQGLAYHAGPLGDRYEATLGPHAQKAWATLIEGWTGPGIRDLCAWRAKGQRADQPKAG